jgi:capsular exopolysaccharide synthesis family protein
MVLFLWRHWKFILFTTAVALSAALFSLAVATPLYTASTQILLDPINEKLASADTANLSFIDALTMDNQIAIVKSSRLLRRVVEKEHLVGDSEFGSRRDQNAPTPGRFSFFLSQSGESIQDYFSHAKNLLWSIASGARVSGAPGGDALDGAGVADRERDKEPGDFETVSREVIDVVGALGAAVTAKRVGQGDVLGINVTSTHPARAARLANAVADAYLLDPLNSRLEAARRTSEWVDERLPELRERLRESEQAVVAFRAEHNLLVGGQNVDTNQEQNLSLNQDQVTQINARLATVRADVAEKKAKVDLLERLEAEGGDGSGLPDTIGSPLLAELRKQLADIEGKEVGLAVGNGERYPEMVKLRVEHDNLRQAVAEEMRRIASKIRNEYSLARAQEETVESLLQDATGRTSLDNKEAIQLRDLERTATVDKGVLEDFLKRASLLQEGSANDARIGRIIAYAVQPDTPSFPNKAVFLSIGLGLGLASGVGLSWARERFSAGFTTSGQAEDLLSLPVLASINRMGPREVFLEKRSRALHRAVPMKPLSPTREAGRLLRSGIQMINLERPPKILQVTSAAKREGKTTTALLLATSSAAAGLKTLLVDANLRNPTITRHFRLREHLGLTDAMRDGANIQDAMCFVEQHGMWVMSAGAMRNDFGDIITPNRVRKLVQLFLAENFECVVFDTPAVAQAADARVIAGFVDKVVFVIKWGSTPKEIVDQNLKLIQGHGNIAGLAFNLVNPRLAKKYKDGRLLAA